MIILMYTCHFHGEFAHGKVSSVCESSLNLNKICEGAPSAFP